MATTDWILLAVQGLVVIGRHSPSASAQVASVSGFGAASGRSSSSSSSDSIRASRPSSAILIIIAVISAAAAMQAAGGVDYMVKIASSALRARPKALNFVAPYVSYLLTILTGTSNTFFSIIPVINEVAYANKIRPERALAGSTVANALGITSSPVAAAMATHPAARRDLQLRPRRRPPHHHPREHRRDLRHVARHEPPRPDLDDDPEYQRRLAAGEVEPPPPAAESSCCRMPSAASPSFSPASPPSVCSASSRGSGRPSLPREAMRADVGDAPHPDVHAHGRGADPLFATSGRATSRGRRSSGPG